LANPLAGHSNFITNGLEAAAPPSIKSVVTGSNEGVSSCSQELAQLSLKSYPGVHHDPLLSAEALEATPPLAALVYQITFKANWMSLGSTSSGCDKPPAPLGVPSELNIWALLPLEKGKGD
jgi:hypothetical protein